MLVLTLLGEWGLRVKKSGWVWGSLNVPFLGLEGARMGSELHGGGGKDLVPGCLWGHACLCALSPLPCLNPWLFWELLATT